MIFLGLSYYVRDRIGNDRWKLIHRFTLLVWVAGLVHTFTEGTDRGQLWFIALIVLTTAPTLVLLVYRVTGRQLRSAAASGGAMSDGIVIAGGGLAAQRAVRDAPSPGVRRRDPDGVRRAAPSL